MKVFRLVPLFAVVALVACGSGESTVDEGGSQDVSGEVQDLDVIGDNGETDATRDVLPADVGGEVADDVVLPDVESDIETDDVTGDVAADVVEDAADVIPEGCPNPSATEVEEFNRTGGNDTFADFQSIPLDETVTGFIGLANDEDWYAFCVDQDGVVNIHIDFTDSYNAYGINWMMFAAYTETWLESNTSVASSEYDGTCFTQAPVNGCLTTIDVQMSVKAAVGRYAFRLDGYGDSEFFAGYDQVNPYTVTVTMVPGDDLEVGQPAVDGFDDYGSGDTWDDATELTLDENGVAEVQSYGWYWNDIDWYKIHIDWPGWIRVVAHIDPVLDGEGYPMVDFTGSVIRMGENGPEDFEYEYPIEWAVPYNDACGTNRGEEYVYGGADYYIRTFSAPGNQTVPYQFKFEYVGGDFEDNQPDVAGADVGAAEDYTDAYDMGSLDLGGTLTVGSYAWHYFEYDWFKFTVPENASQNVSITWDFSASYTAKGWYACPDNENGIENWMYMFDETSSDFPGIAQGYEDDVPTQTMTYAVEAGKTYYILLMSREDWDQTNPYSLTITGTP